ncbi:MAG: N-acetyltransferase [bacterium]
MNMFVVRNERPEDFDAVHYINNSAFGQPGEANLVDRLRSSCPEAISLVAVLEDRVVGHILFSPVKVEGDRTLTEGMGLGPMAVLPEYQRRGIGSKMVEAGLDRLKELSCPFVVVLGHSHYYPRFGFKPASDYRIRCEWDVPDNVFMIRFLDRTLMAQTSGVARYCNEFGDLT